MAARKVVTALFCDVADSTALGELLDAEVLQAVLSRYLRLASAVIERHGGTVQKFIGDAVMAVFGVPVLHEDDAVRACRAAEELLAELPRWNDELERDFGTRLQLRVGVNSGEVAAVSDQRLATGDAVNVAARLEQAAEPGQILIGPLTLALARDAVTVEALEPLELKGKGRPVQAYRLLAVEPGRPRRSTGLAPMVGRADEKGRLDEEFADVVARRTCRVVTILGNAGLGKSRLAGEFLEGLDVRVVTGRCLSYGEGITYWPVVEVVKQLGDVVERLMTRTPQVAAALAALMGEGSAATPGEIAWAVRRVFEEAAAERPLVIVFDDIHWGEPIFLDLIEHVADLSHEASILIVCLARPELLERRPAWRGRRPGAATLLLQPLDTRETSELIDRLVDPGELDPALTLRIGTASEGNPLFVEEMVAMARDSEVEELEVPPTIKALLAARIDQLDPAERSVLERGSVEGQLFHRSAVEALADSPEPTLEPLAGLVRKELVRPDRPTLPDEDAYRFRHLLIRDAAYEALPKAVRAVLHERFAVWLQASGTELVERDEIVGFHLEQAYRYRVELAPIDVRAETLAVLSAEHLERAGRRSFGRGDMRAAANLWRRSAQLLPERSRERLELLPSLGEALMEMGEFSEAQGYLSQAVVGAAALDDQRLEADATLTRLLVAHHTVEDLDAFRAEVRREVDRVLPSLNGDEAATVRAKAWRMVAITHGIVCLWQETTDALEHAIAAARRAEDARLVARLSAQYVLALSEGPVPATEAIARAETVMSEGLVDRQAEAVVLLELAPLRAMIGDVETARELYAQGGDILRELGNTVIAAWTSHASSFVELLAGDPQAAESLLRADYDALTAIDEQYFRPFIAALLARALLALGRATEAGEFAAVAAQLASADDVETQVIVRSVRARILASKGAFERAVTLADEAVELAARTDCLVQRGDALLALADVLRSSGAAKDSKPALQYALELFERKENFVQAAQTRKLLRDLEMEVASEST